MKTCIVCQHSELNLYSDQHWEVWGDDYRLVRCASCSSVFTDPLPSGDVLARVYAECFDYRWYQDHYSAKYRDCRKRIDEYRSLLGKRVLDFGGGVGYLSAALREKGYDSQTYDPFCKQGDQVDSGWETVIALHVLEHANDPDNLILEMKKLMASGGRLILAVPNAAGRGYRDLGMQWVWAQPPLVHIIHFTSVGLQRLLERHGFIVESVSYAERWDANCYTDLDEVHRFRLLDSLWGRQPYNRFGWYRKACAFVSSSLRFRGLNKVMKSPPADMRECSELQMVARYKDL